MTNREKNPKISRCVSPCKPHLSSVVSYVMHNYVHVYVCFIYYMVYGRIDIRARVNYFSHNSEHRDTGLEIHAPPDMHPNIMHFSSPILPPLSLLFSFPFSFFSTLAIFEHDKRRICREAKLDKTLHPPSPPPVTPRRAFRML